MNGSSRLLAAAFLFVAIFVQTPGPSESAEPRLTAAVFVADITPAIGPGPCVGYMRKVDTIETKLEARGVLLRFNGQTHALVAMDLNGVCNSSHDRLRDAVAGAIGAKREHVAVQSIHQHTAPAIDVEASDILFAGDDALLKSTRDYETLVATRMADAAREATSRLSPVTRVVGSRAQVERVASNRRVPQPDGTIAVRGSGSREQSMRDAPEGTIDPWVRTITFHASDRPLAQLHYYATHPQSYYGDHRISWDVPGFARSELEKETGVPQIYFNGCGGNIGMGKYNRAIPEDRAPLIERLLAGMRASSEAGRSSTSTASALVDVQEAIDGKTAAELAWAVEPLAFGPRVDGEFADDRIQAAMTSAPSFPARLTAVEFFTWQRRLRKDHKIDVPRLRIGAVEAICLPGEPFVEFQLFAQAKAPQSFVCVAGYGECGVWYFGPDSIFTDRGGYEQTWSFTTPCQEKVETTLAKLLAR